MEPKGKKKEAIDNMRETMWNLDEKLNELTKGEYFGEFSSRGLCTFKVKEIKELLEKYPQMLTTLREAIKVHLEFDKTFFGIRLWNREKKHDESLKNIVALDIAFPAAFSLKAYAVAKAKTHQ